MHNQRDKHRQENNSVIDGFALYLHVALRGNSQRLHNGGVMREDAAAPEEGESHGKRVPLAMQQAEKVETPGVFLAELSEALRASDGVDTDLAAALTEHLLTVTPHADAVANAKSAIVALASERAARVGENADG